MLARTPLAEASASLLLLTEEFGLARARAQGVRKPGAKMAGALATLAESDVILVKGKDGWRLSGANLARNRARELSESQRRRAGRIASLLLRLVHGETGDPQLFFIISAFLDALPSLSEDDGDAAETLVALQLLAALGLAEVIPEALYDPVSLAAVAAKRRDYILRINRGITASGL